ncbi:MAG: hypothetical protein AAF990_27795 [Bacteroidota bacterium]
MNHTKDINQLSELLSSLKNQLKPSLVQLCSRIGIENNLMDRVIRNVREQYGEQLFFMKVSSDASRILKQELQTSKNPVLLLVHKGELKAVFGGIVAQYRLVEALEGLSLKTN